MRRVLIIAYYFPPDGKVGGIRPHGLAKYLPESGWEAVVLTGPGGAQVSDAIEVATTEGRPSRRDMLKERLGLGADTTVRAHITGEDPQLERGAFHRLCVLAEEPFTIPDDLVEWKGEALERTETLGMGNFDAVITTSFPYTCHLVGKGLKRRHALPWVADLRDLWTLNHYYQYTPVRKLFERRMELDTLGDADELVTVTTKFADDLSGLHGRPVSVIPNGFDPDEVNPDPCGKTERFTITYTGGLYGGRRDPSALFRATREMLDEGLIDPEGFEIRFFGRYQDWLQSMIDDHGLGSCVKQYGLVPREEALRHQRESHVNLMIFWDDPGDMGMVHAKYFEYIAALRPILAYGRNRGIMSDMMEEQSTGVYATDVAGLKKAMLRWYRGDMGSYDIDRLDHLSQRRMARQFAEILDRVVLDR